MSQAPSKSSLSGFIGSGLAGAAAFGALGAYGYSVNKKSIEKAYEQDIERIGDYITQARVDRILDTEHLAREAQVAVGNAMNVSPEGLSSLETIASRVVAGVASDQFAIDTELDRRETAALAEMNNVETRANNALAGAATQVGQSIGEGFQAGSSLYAAIKQTKRDAVIANAQTKMADSNLETQDANNAILDETLKQQKMKTDFEVGYYKRLVAGNEALANSVGARVGLAQVFNQRYGGPADPFYKWGIGAPAQ